MVVTLGVIIQGDLLQNREQNLNESLANSFR